MPEPPEYTPTTIHLYFKDKAELVTCLQEETFAKLAALHREIGVRHGDPSRFLRRGVVLPPVWARTLRPLPGHVPRDRLIEPTLETLIQGLKE